MKKFYNNRLVRFAPNGALRFVALLCVLLGFSSSALATYYIDARDYMSLGKTFTISWLQNNKSESIAYQQVGNGLWSFDILFDKAEFNANGKATKYGPGQEQTLPALSGNNNCYVISSTGKPTAAQFSGTSGGGSTGGNTGGGDDSGDDTGGSTGGGTTGDCSKVLIYCRGEQGSYTDMHCHSWGSAGDITTWPGRTADRKETYNGNTYAVWEFEGDVTGLQFNDGNKCETGNYTTQTLKVGNMYVFELAYNNNSWCGVVPSLYASEKLKCDTPDDPIIESTDVLLTRDAEYNEDTNTATVYGYLKQHPNEDQCTEIEYYGFAFCKGSNCTVSTDLNTQGAQCNKYIWAEEAGPGGIQLERGVEFTGKFFSNGCSNSQLEEGTVYGYRAYVYDGSKFTFSAETRYFSTGGCIPSPGGGDTIRITVDAETYFNSDTAQYNNCFLRYGNLYRAIKELKANRDYVDENGNLLQPVIITVAQVPSNYNDVEECKARAIKTVVAAYTGGDTRTVSGGTENEGYVRNLKVLPIEGFNQNKTTGYHPLIIKAKEGHKPRIQHLLIRSSRGVVLDGLGFYSNAKECGKEQDTALEIDNGKCNDWHTVEQDFKNGDITIKNCVIGSNGFTGAHITAYEGLTFENNIFNLSVEDVSSNAAAWGASVKFFECKNIKFVRNNLMGEHGTLIWLQQTTNVLIYNNVFWNTNKYNAKCMAIRVYKQYPENDTHKAKYQMPSNIACLYNTFFLEDNTNNANEYDFFGGKAGNPIDGQMTFMYNNCYSYDNDVPGAAKVGLDMFIGTKNFCPNNFWSIYDVKNHKTKSVFQFEECTGNTKFINVSELLCETTASGPAFLIVRQPSEGNGLKEGTPLKAANIKAYVGSDIEITDDELKHDRNHDNVRKGSSWTLGAYEASVGSPIQTIYWIGGTSSDWDNRNNWRWKDKNGKEQPLTCVDFLSPDLEVIIPERNSKKYPVSSTGKHYYPNIPVSFDEKSRSSSRDKIPASEQVSAGKGYANITPEKFASTIELEYGAAIKGVEVLGSKYYDNAKTHLETSRREWILVGSVINPWKNKDDRTQGVRNIVSNDYYLNHFPHVYMRQAELVGESAKWNNPFPQLTEVVELDKVFAIKVEDEYGYYKVPAAYYYTRTEDNPDMVDDGIRPKTFDFEGRFQHENTLQNFGKVEKGKMYLFCNTYPANISVEKFMTAYPGTIQKYMYATNLANSRGGSFTKIDESNFKDNEILSQNGFVYQAGGNYTIELDSTFYGNGSTKVRSAMSSLPKFRLYATNINAPRESDVFIEIDELKSDEIDYKSDATKIFNNTTEEKKVPELYVMRYDAKWSGITIPTMEEPIPLGLRTSRNNVSVRFSVKDVKDLGSIILEDRMEGKTYDLTRGEECVIETLPKGDNENRFFLNLKAAEVEEPDDDNITTEVEDEMISESGIIIIGNSEGIIVSCSSDIQLQTIIVNDMSGKSASYKVSGQYAEIKLPVAKGIYTVNVIGDTATKTGKVILK